MSKNKQFVYPRSVLASLKGNSFACIEYLEARRNKTRRSRKKWKQFTTDIFKDNSNE